MEAAETSHHLSEGALLTVMTGGEGLKPVIQVLEVAKMSKNQCRIKVSDGLYWYDAVSPDTVFNDQEIDNYSIVSMNMYTVDITRKQVILVGECEVRTLMCFELTVMTPGYDVLREIGKPKYLFDSVLYRDFVEQHRYFNSSARSGARIRAQNYELSEGVLRTMMMQQTPKKNPVTQILRKTDLSIDRHIQRCNLLLSDGIFYYDAVLLSPQLKNEAFNSSLENYAIIRIFNYAVTYSGYRRQMALFDLEVVATADEVGQLVGYPQPLPTKWTREYFRIPTSVPVRTSMTQTALTAAARATSPVAPKTDDRPATKRKQTTGRFPAPRRARSAASTRRRDRSTAASTPRRGRSTAASTPRRDRSTAASTPRRDRSTAASTPRRDRSTATSTPRRARSGASAPRRDGSTAASTPRRGRSTAASTPRRDRSTAASTPRRDKSTAASNLEETDQQQNRHLSTSPLCNV